MTYDELTQVAIDYLGRAFTARPSEVPAPPPQMVQAAVSIILSPRNQAELAQRTQPAGTNG